MQDSEEDIKLLKENITSKLCNYSCFNDYTLLIIELEEELREKKRENESLIKSVEILQVKTGIIIHVADFVQPNFYFVNLEQAFICLTYIVPLTAFILSSHFMPAFCQTFI